MTPEGVRESVFGCLINLAICGGGDGRSFLVSEDWKLWADSFEEFAPELTRENCGFVGASWFTGFDNEACILFVSPEEAPTLPESLDAVLFTAHYPTELYFRKKS